MVRYAAHRFRDSHDIWHVVCGFRSDLAGEAGILAFYSAQTRSPGLFVLLLGALLHSLIVGRQQGKTMRHLAWIGWRSGTRAMPLAAAPWEECRSQAARGCACRVADHGSAKVRAGLRYRPAMKPYELATACDNTDRGQGRQAHRP